MIQYAILLNIDIGALKGLKIAVTINYFYVLLSNLVSKGEGNMQQKRWMGYAILIFITLIWGTTFTVTKSSLDSVPPLYFLAWRFSIASMGLLLLNFKVLPTITREELIGGLVIGVTLAAGFIAQTVGMVYSTAAKAGFITGLAVVLVPFMGALLFKRRPSFYVYISASVAAVGLALLSLDLSAGVRLNRGDLYLLLCAISFAAYILFLGKYAPRNRVMMLTTVQVVFTCIMCWIATIFLEQPVTFTGPVWTGLVYLAIVATIFTTAGQTWGQKRISPERAALIFTLEPVFALLFAMLLLGERLPPAGILGSVLIMVGIIGAELAPRKGKQVGV